LFKCEANNVLLTGVLTTDTVDDKRNYLQKCFEYESKKLNIPALKAHLKKQYLI